VSGNPPSYEAVRTPDFLYVEYRDGEREFYDLRTDPYEIHNLARMLSPDQLGRLHERLLALENCHTGPSCWAAEHIDPFVPQSIMAALAGQRRVAGRS
jgi:N-acetylglucosamine-6-sulfatase